MRKIRFWTAHAVPRRHVTEYEQDGARQVAVWRQWSRPCGTRATTPCASTVSRAYLAGSITGGLFGAAFSAALFVVFIARRVGLIPVHPPRPRPS